MRPLKKYYPNLLMIKLYQTHLNLEKEKIKEVPEHYLCFQNKDFLN